MTTTPTDKELLDDLRSGRGQTGPHWHPYEHRTSASAQLELLPRSSSFAVTTLVFQARSAWTWLVPAYPA